MIPPPIIVFVRPQAPGNLGALARVMSNFGCSDFRYTGGFPQQSAQTPNGFSTMDWAMARKGDEILRQARCYPNLEAALEGVHCVIGSSGREREYDGGYARPHVTPQEALQTVESWNNKSPGTSWAFVLGPEDDGLNQQESALCQKLVRLPTVDQAPSMNVAMAAGCFLYHWHLINLGWAHKSTSEDPGPFPFLNSQKPSFTETGRSQWADQTHKERFLDYLMVTIGRTDFLKYPDVESVRARVRRWLQAAPIPLGELLFAFEVVYHFRAWGSGGKFETRGFLTKEE